MVRKLSLAVGAMIEGRTPNTVELSNLLPLELERQYQREQWLRRLLSSPVLSCETVIEPFAQEALRHAGQNRQIILLSLDQTDLGDRMAVLMLTVRLGDRSLPLARLVRPISDLPSRKSCWIKSGNGFRPVRPSCCWPTASIRRWACFNGSRPRVGITVCA